MQKLRSFLCDQTLFAFHIHRFGYQERLLVPCLAILLWPEFTCLIRRRVFRFYDADSDQSVSEQELEGIVANNESELTVDSPTTSDENDLLELVSEHSSASDNDANELIVHSPTLNEEKASSASSTSSSDIMLEDPFQEQDNSHGETTNNGIDYATESPPVQMMERLSSTPSNYRIPSSAFARKESNVDGWGMASNESLFSITMGGMSFRNQDSLNWRSGELDLAYGIEPSPSGKSMIVGSIPELDETSESDGSEKNVERDEAAKDQEIVEQGRPHMLGEEDKIKSLSEISDKMHGPKRVKSYKGLTADTNKGHSAKVTGSRIETSEPQSDTSPDSEPQPELDKQTEPPKADPPAATWTNCFG
ncbi:hypothetical protein M8C21_023341, partial [Ambrosia artemisiifolia]